MVTMVSTVLQTMGQESADVFGCSRSLSGISGVLLYLLGFGGEVFLLTSVYLVMPVRRLSLRHALIGAVTAAVLWEITRHVLGWYFATLSQVAVVYGSLTTAIVVLLSLELGATLLLLGAQVISEYELVGKGAQERTAETVSYRPDARLVPADQVQQRDRYVVLKRGAPEGQCVAIRELSGQAAP